MERDNVAKLLKDKNVKSVALNFVDSLGKLYSLWIPPSELEVAEKGGVVMSGHPYFTDAEKSDVLIKPDLSSFRVFPWTLEGKTIAGVMCDLYQPGTTEELEEVPRSLLKRAVRKLKKDIGADMSLFAAPEIEYFLLRRDANGNLQVDDNASYFSPPPTDRGYELREQIVDALAQMEIKVVKHHHEGPPGKHEINIEYDTALNMADKVQYTKMVIRKFASEKGLIATFMPKPFSFNWGAGHHTHLSLQNEKSGENLFYSKDGKYGLSDTALFSIQGILSHAKALVAITNPTVNSYKRMMPESQAPMYIAWSKFNRTTLLRIPSSGAKGTRLEYRPSDGSCTVYLSFAALIYAALDGIARKTFTYEPFDENIYAFTKAERVKRGIEELPTNLEAALDELEKDEVIQKSLGTLYQKFLRIKREEWMEYSGNVYDWEREKYLDDSQTMQYVMPVWRASKK